MSASSERKTTPRERLADLYRERDLLAVQVARVDTEIEKAETYIAFLREQHGRLPRETIKHGDESAYQRHIRRHIPFPEDVGEKPCGCRRAHAAYERDRAARATHREQPSLLEVLAEQARSTGVGSVDVTARDAARADLSASEDGTGSPLPAPQGSASVNTHSASGSRGRRQGPVDGRVDGE